MIILKAKGKLVNINQLGLHFALLSSLGRGHRETTVYMLISRFGKHQQLLTPGVGGWGVGRVEVYQGLQMFTEVTLQQTFQTTA